MESVVGMATMCLKAFWPQYTLNNIVAFVMGALKTPRLVKNIIQ
jgi:hypothetical protein